MRFATLSRANKEDSREEEEEEDWFLVDDSGRARTSHNGTREEEEEEDLSYETSHNCAPIGTAEECNLSPDVYLRK